LLDTPPTNETEETTDDVAADEESESLPSLYRHSKRQKWGLGLIIRKLDDRAHMQFQDGRLRTLHLDYSHLLEPVDRPYDVARGLVEALESMAPDELRPSQRRGPAPISMDEQVEYFRELYAGGFKDEAYSDEHRGDGRKRPLKRHRDALIARAQKELSKQGIAKHRSDGGASAVHKAATKVVKLTNLVPAKERRAFGKIDEHHHEAVATTLRALLHGTSPLAQRLDAWVRTLETAMGQAPSWPMATVFLGAVSPNKHVVVKPKTFERQARFMAPGLRAGERPMGLLYARLQAMADATRERMGEKGLAPRDLMDVHDFMWLTLKPAARRRINEIRMTRVDVPMTQGEADAESEAA